MTCEVQCIIARVDVRFFLSFFVVATGCMSVSVSVCILNIYIYISYLLFFFFATVLPISSKASIREMPHDCNTFFSLVFFMAAVILQYLCHCTSIPLLFCFTCHLLFPDLSFALF